MPQIGNSIAGQGGLQAATAVMMLAEQKLPARVHAGAPAGGLRPGRSPARAAELGKVVVQRVTTNDVGEVQSVDEGEQQGLMEGE